MKKDTLYYRKILINAVLEYERNLSDGAVSTVDGVSYEAFEKDLQELRAILANGEIVLILKKDKNITNAAFANATDMTVAALREYTDGLSPGSLLDEFEALLTGLLHRDIILKRIS